MKSVIISSMLLVGLTGLPAWAGPGDPFGGDDTGCVPSDKSGVGCGKVVTAALGKLTASVIKCHLVQAGHAFQTGHSAIGFDNAEENCETGNPTNSAKAKFDAYMVKAASYCAANPSIVTNANTRANTMVADQSNPASLDALNGAFFCDNTSGLTIAEPGGDDAGFIPANAGNYKCSVLVAKAYGKLIYSVYKCHNKAAAAAFAGKAFDEELCEETAPKGALARYNAYVGKAIAAGICPPCLAGNAVALGAAGVSDVDASNHEIYPCPGP